MLFPLPSIPLWYHILLILVTHPCSTHLFSPDLKITTPILFWNCPSTWAGVMFPLRPQQGHGTSLSLLSSEELITLWMPKTWHGIPSTNILFRILITITLPFSQCIIHWAFGSFFHTLSPTCIDVTTSTSAQYAARKKHCMFYILRISLNCSEWKTVLFINSSSTRTVHLTRLWFWLQFCSHLFL